MHACVESPFLSHSSLLDHSCGKLQVQLRKQQCEHRESFEAIARWQQCIDYWIFSLVRGSRVFMFRIELMLLEIAVEME